MLSEVMPGLQQLNREAHPRDKQARSRRERRPCHCTELHIILSLPCGEKKRHTRSMNHRAVALRIELAHKVDDHLYPRVILLTVSLLTAICLFPYH